MTFPWQPQAAKKRAHPLRRPRRTVRPKVEVLEDRTLLSLFGVQTPFPVGTTPVSVAVEDFNTDGKPDLVTANYDSGNVSVLLGDGSGGFSNALGSPFPVGSGPYSVAVGDFNHDRKPDLAVANDRSGTVSVLLGDGHGAFSDAPGSPFPVGTSPQSVAVGDFNTDGKPDLAVATNDDNKRVSVLLGDGTGGFGAATSFPVGLFPVSVAVGDFNRDGKPDLAVANEGNSNVSVLPGNGSGGFAAAVNFPVGSAPFAVAVGDFNHDGGLDLAVTHSQFGTVSVLLNQTPVTTATLTSSASTAVAGQLITFTATVTAAEPGQPAPTGLVTFKDGITVLGSGTLDGSGQASFNTFSLSTGYHAVTAVYQGDPLFSGSTAPALNQLVNQDATTTALAASANPAVAGQPLTLTATVLPAAPSSGTATGTVLFWDGTAALGSGRLSGGVATCTTAALAPGSHALRAVYVGDGSFTGSTGGLTQDVAGPASPPPLPPPQPANAVLPLTDVTGQVAVARGRLRFDRRTGRTRLWLRLTNTGSGPLTGPISFVLVGLPKGVTLRGRTGLTTQMLPGSAFQVLPLGPAKRVLVTAPLPPGAVVTDLGGDADAFLPGETRSLRLTFRNPAGARFGFRWRILAGVGLR